MHMKGPYNLRLIFAFAFSSISILLLISIHNDARVFSMPAINDNTDAMKVELGIITSRKELICATI